MREDLTRIIASLISNIGGVHVTALGCDNQEIMGEIAQNTCNGLEVLKKKWPSLTFAEKEEIAAIILTLKTTYPTEEERKAKK
jgi:altronate dehydratase